MKSADAMPTKDFFVRMITRDISLEDCILDLIDNCLDGARREISRTNASPIVESYNGFRSELSIDATQFRIDDNCGGISVSNAIDYAFHFGRRPDAPTDGEFSIGLYGIGMKRAILKMGKRVKIHSSTGEEAFICKINVDDWLSHDRWEFDMDDAEKIEGTGTRILIEELYKGVAAEFGDEAFLNRLVRILARDYARFIQKGFAITVNGKRVKGHVFALKASGDFQPYRVAYEDEGVHVEVVAGMAAAPPDSIEPTNRPDTDYYGWFVLCNDRVVLAADKSDRTVWGDEGFARWHPQFNGFMGLVLFNASDAELLPWTTTKRAIDESSPLYRRAVTAMKAATQPWIDYTNQRKGDLDEAKAKEREAKSVSLFEVAPNPSFKVPTTQARRSVVTSTITYQKKRTEIQKVASALGNAAMSNKAVGEKTFEYYLENEVERAD
jgi:hypothetical protein